jgi:putative ABC transport system permease protein
VNRHSVSQSRLLPRDLLTVGSIGLRTRRLRAALSALGIAIGIASMVAVLGISASSQAALLDTIDRLGTNLLTVQAGQSFFGDDSELPESTGAKLSSMSGVDASASVYDVSGVTARRTERVDAQETLGISVKAADTELPETLSAKLAQGRFLDDATKRYPAVVLGDVAAERLGIVSLEGQPQIYVGGRYLTVVGILKPVTLASAIDRSVLVGLPYAEAAFDTEPNASSAYVRVDESRFGEIRNLVPGTANPGHPEEVEVSRPSDALEAKAAAQGAFTSLFLGLGAVALLVGGVGIANVMVISVLERRSEIGLRRALGATRRHISIQFLTESLLLATLGGIAGAFLGALVTAISSAAQGQAVVIPPEAIAGGILAALLIGAAAGLYPSIRASRLSPTEALRTV